MPTRVNAVLAAALVLCLIPAAGRAIEAYAQDFELLFETDPDALAEDGWLVYGSVFAPDGTFLYGYGAFPAPNHQFAFCQIDIGQGGPEQGLQQLSVFSDYENDDHANGLLIESNVFQEQEITAEDVGSTWRFSFQAKRGNIEGESTAVAFIKTIDPENNFDQTNFITEDMTDIPDTWGGWSIQIPIIEELVGQLVQFGFANTATLYQGSGIFYDNVVWEEAPVGVPDAAMDGAALGQNYPNPFNPRTRIDFSLEQAGPVAVTVYDLAGRHVATLQQGELPAGDHHVIWDGRTDAGRLAPAGQYRYALRTATGTVSRSMVLVK